MTHKINNVIFNSFFIFSIAFLGLAIGDICISAPNRNSDKITARTTFGSCPTKSAGTLAMTILEEFEKNHSLRDVKMRMLDENLIVKHYISDYKVTYDPVRSVLNISLDCPEPFMNVQFFKDNKLESYNAILVENGKLYDPTYEMLLKMDNKLKRKLPFLALPDPKGNIDEAVKDQIGSITELIKNMKPKFRKTLSEIIINDQKELTMMLSVNGRTSSVFFADTDWNSKVVILQRLMAYMMEKKHVPSIINLTNAQKVLVKFKDKF